MTLEEKLARFKESALQDATSQSEDILNECETTIQKKYDDYKKEAQRRTEHKIKIETQNLTKHKNQMLTKDSIEIKRLINEKSMDLTNILFKDVEKKILDYKKTSSYKDMLIAQINKSLKFADSDKIIIYIDPTDSALKKSLEQACKVSLEISATDFLGGTRAVIHSKNILIDNSFATKLAEEKSTFTL